jgi:hypothetical protein
MPTMQPHDSGPPNDCGSRRRIDARDRLAAASKQLRLARQDGGLGARDQQAIRTLERDVAHAAPLRFRKASDLWDGGSA